MMCLPFAFNDILWILFYYHSIVRSFDYREIWNITLNNRSPSYNAFIYRFLLHQILKMKWLQENLIFFQTISSFFCKKWIFIPFFNLFSIYYCILWIDIWSNCLTRYSDSICFFSLFIENWWFKQVCFKYSTCKYIQSTIWWCIHWVCSLTIESEWILKE